ncbi:MAG TPA: S-methyl-5-thioribose-1-phosphate isomerase [Candidatus Acidoferrales bacterium]|nr:S-methyl-5-thioribose-1-phosphate isomerase [Candidatus Acidoferrales bacterium]
MHTVEPIRWTAEGIVILDQRLLPGEVVYRTYTDYRDVAKSIKDMEIRGAPAIGVAAAMGIALGVQHSQAQTLQDLKADFEAVCDAMARTRPTAVDLFWAIERFKKKFRDLALAANGGTAEVASIKERVVEEARTVHQERREADERIGRFGAELMPKSGRVMTQCNAGALATGGIGTALGVIRVAVEMNHRIEVLVPETRPYLQGARLTAWELHQDGIPLTLITDNMVGHFLKTGAVGAVVVGADRIAANGDTANKIGTYGIAVLARENNVPFYVAAPLSTLDLSIRTGEQIPIEQRSAEEVTHLAGKRISPDVPAAHPAFDVTQARFISAIVTERGVARAPYEKSLGAMIGATMTHAGAPAKN